MTAGQALFVGLIAAVLFVASVAGLAGVFWAMMAAAAVLAVSAVLLYDPTTSRKANRPF